MARARRKVKHRSPENHFSARTSDSQATYRSCAGNPPANHYSSTAHSAYSTLFGARARAARARGLSSIIGLVHPQNPERIGRRIRPKFRRKRKTPMVATREKLKTPCYRGGGPPETHGSYTDSPGRCARRQASGLSASATRELREPQTSVPHSLRPVGERNARAKRAPDFSHS